MILSITFMIICYNANMKQFGEKIKELRLERNLTQKQLANILDNAQSAIVYWEANKQEPTISALKKLCIFFDVSADYLLGLEDESGTKLRAQVNNLSHFHNSGTIKF